MPYLLVKTTFVAVILGLFAYFAQAEATPRFTLNEVTMPALPVGYGRGYDRYGGGYGRGYGGYGGGYGHGCGRDYY
jgi:hypothetical protein